MEKVLVTGHKGFVGRHFVKYFETAGTQVHGIDLKDGNDCRDYFRGCSRDKYDLVVHLAAAESPPPISEKEPLAVATDLSIDAEMFNWAVRTGQPKIVYYSSSAAYPTRLQTHDKHIALKESDIDLDNILNPDFTYGWAKLTGEMLANYAKRSGVNVFVFRPFSGFGEDQDLTYPFPSFVDRIKRKVDEFEIWGDGTQIRDFIYIEDIVKATMKAVESNYQEPLNLGTGVPTQFNDLAETMFKIARWKPPKGIKHRLDKPVGVSNRYCDPSKLQQIYKIEYDLESTIRKIFRIQGII